MLVCHLSTPIGPERREETPSRVGVGTAPSDTCRKTCSCSWTHAFVLQPHPSAIDTRNIPHARDLSRVGCRKWKSFDSQKNERRRDWKRTQRSTKEKGTHPPKVETRRHGRSSRGHSVDEDAWKDERKKCDGRTSGRTKGCPKTTRPDVLTRKHVVRMQAGAVRRSVLAVRLQETRKGAPERAVIAIPTDPPKHRRIRKLRQHCSWQVQPCT